MNRWSETRLAGIFGRYADEPYTIEIAWDIVRWMETLPWERGGIHSTLELRYVIEKAVEGIVSSSSNYAGTSPGKEEDGVGGGAHEKGGTKRADDFSDIAPYGIRRRRGGGGGCPHRGNG